MSQEGSILTLMLSINSLPTCVFCGSEDMSEEHVIADWALRAFGRSRRPFLRRGAMTASSIPGASGLRVTPEEPFLTAKVVCRTCNNGWLSDIDRAASEVLKPVLQSGTTVTLSTAGQTAAANWVYKSAIVFDVAEHGRHGPLAPLREPFFAAKQAGARAGIWLGPASDPGVLPLSGTEIGLWRFGVQPTKRLLRLSMRINSADGSTSSSTESVHPIPGYHVMLGNLWAFLGHPHMPPVDDQALRGFAQVWPAMPTDVAVSGRSKRVPL